MMIPAFDATQCQGGLLKGYSGCMCDYCRTYRYARGRWIVNSKGGPGESAFEISVLRANNRHGIASFGWFDEAKLLISHNGGPCRDSVISVVWDGLMELAQSVANTLNAQENQ